MIGEIRSESFRLCARSLGAELTSFCDLRGGEYEYIWQNREIWNGQSPLLFPIVGRLKGDRYRLNGREYSLNKHGFARRSEFRLETQGETEMTFLLTDSAQTLERYPFPFELRAHYALTADGFVMETRVRNTGAETMWFSLGAHPGFRCEMGDQIVMDAEETVSAFLLGENGLREPEQVPVFDHSRQLVLAPDTFARDALIFDGLKSRGAALVRRNGRNVHVDFGGASCLGLWARPGAEYVCIEPWYGVDDRWDADGDFTRKERIQSLEPGAEFAFPVTVKV